MLRNAVGALAVGASLFFCAVPANAVTVTYALTFTPTQGTATGGTGVLTLNEFPGLLTTIGTNGNDHDGIAADFVSLTVHVDGFDFTFNNSNVFFIGELNGVWNNISANSNQTSDGVHQFSIGAGGLTYNLQEINVTQIGGGTITVGPGVIVTAGGTDSTTPLPAALPLFASGAGVLGFFGWRRKRKAAALAFAS